MFSREIILEKALYSVRRIDIFAKASWQNVAWDFLYVGMLHGEAKAFALDDHIFIFAAIREVKMFRMRNIQAKENSEIASNA